jgi:polyribonucleotide nucleotidyltransferase
VVGAKDKIVMLEGSSDQVDEDIVCGAIEFARPYIKNVIAAQHELREKCGKPKAQLAILQHNEALNKVVKETAMPKIIEHYGKAFTKEDREKIIAEIFEHLKTEIIKEENKELFISEDHESEIQEILLVLEEDYARKKIIETGVRPDGRAINEIRTIDCQVGVLPRTHGSALFTRGQTQALAVVTIGTSSDEQTVEELEGTQSKYFMLHYNFPPFSVGETKPMRGPSRRDIGHGNLAERSIFSVLPTREIFPYTLRVVSEILESNGSSSMATVCATSMALMDSGVPLQEAVAGIAMGLVKEGDKHKILTDIAGIEDHSGDMDFKVAGTKNGIVAVQLDIKIDGLDFALIKETLQRAKEGRLFILDKMNAAMPQARTHLSKYAPKMKTFKIDPDKIGMLIGPGGKNIRRLSSDNNVTIDISDETETVFIVAQNDEDLERATSQVMGIIRDTEVGDIYDAVVARIVNFGAFCEFAPGKSGLVHVSEIADGYVKDVTSVLKEGDRVKVKVIGIDNQGRINLSIKQAQEG